MLKTLRCLDNLSLFLYKEIFSLRSQPLVFVKSVFIKSFLFKLMLNLGP